MSQTEEKLAAHVGVASSLAPPKEEKRQRRSGGSPGAWLKRGGWAAADAEPEKPPKPDNGEPKKKRASGRRKTVAEKAAEKAAAREARELERAEREAAAEAAAAEAAKRGPRELFPESGDLHAFGSPAPAAGRAAGKGATSSSLGGGKKKAATESGVADGLDADDEEVEDADDDAAMGDGDGFDGGMDGDGMDGDGMDVDGITPGGAPGSKRKRNRGKRTEEGDRKELKARHLKGKRKDEQLASQKAHLELAAKRRKQRFMGGAGGSDSASASAFAPSAVGGPSAVVGEAEAEAEGTEADYAATAMLLPPSRQAQLDRLLRPKARRWVMYEWFYAPGDYAWLRDNAFMRALQDAGLGHVTHLTRSEWSFVRQLLGRARRLSPTFLAQERERLNEHRERCRAYRRIQLQGGALGGGVMLSIESSGDDSLPFTSQLAVGQRVTAFHPKERHIFTGTVLTPDGDHYRIQFDRQKLGVYLVEDHLVVPMLDGSRGIDFTSPHGLGQDTGGASGAGWGGVGDDGDGSSGRTGMNPSAHGSVVKADPQELQLLAYILRLLERKKLLMNELKKVCGEAERELRSAVEPILVDAHKEGVASLVVPEEELKPPPVRLEVSAAQQRVLGQVPTPPVVPAIGALLTQLRSTSPDEATHLERRVAMWKQEIEWLQDEMRGTARALDNALTALRPTAQRFSMVLGAAAPEPLSRGLGVSFCAELRDCANEHATSALAATLSERQPEKRRGSVGDGSEGASAQTESDGTPSVDAIPGEVKLLAPPVRETLSSAVSLLLQVQGWAQAPMSPTECRIALLAALKKLTPACDANRASFADVMATAQMLQNILCGIGVPGVPAGGGGRSSRR